MIKESPAMAEQILKAVSSLFKLTESENLPQTINQWLNSLPEVVFEGNLSPHAQAFLAVMRGQGDFVEKITILLPKTLEFPEIQNWGETELNQYKWRIARAKLEAEVFRLKDFFPIPQSQEEKAAYFEKWVKALLEDYNCSEKEKESLLLDLLEAAVW